MLLGDTMEVEMVVTSFFSYMVIHLGPLDEVMWLHRVTGYSWWPTGHSGTSVSGRMAGCTTSGTQSQVCTPAEPGHTSGSHGSLWVALMSCWAGCRVSSESWHSTLWPLLLLVPVSLKSQDLWALTQGPGTSPPLPYFLKTREEAKKESLTGVL